MTTTTTVLSSTTDASVIDDQPTSLPLCSCGCGAVTITKKATFLPGHDARLKGYLLRTIRGEARTTDRAFTVEEAQALLASRGWGHFLVERKAKASKAKAEPKVTFDPEVIAQAIDSLTETSAASLKRLVEGGEAITNGKTAKALAKRELLNEHSMPTPLGVAVAHQLA